MALWVLATWLSYDPIMDLLRELQSFIPRTSVKCRLDLFFGLAGGLQSSVWVLLTIGCHDCVSVRLACMYVITIVALLARMRHDLSLLFLLSYLPCKLRLLVRHKCFVVRLKLLTSGFALLVTPCWENYSNTVDLGPKCDQQGMLLLPV